jgi:hypothetical protein
MSPRNASQFNRQKKVRTKTTDERILIVCEGTRTEPNYFAGFQKELRSREIARKVYLKIEPAGMVSLSLVKEAIRLRDLDGEYDQVWCVFDRDLKKENNNQQNFNAAIHLADKNSINLAVSNDAFELWFLLHYEYYSSQTHRTELRKKLSGRLGEKYGKSSDDMYEKLKDKQTDAIKYAEKLWSNCQENYNTNPSTTVFKLVEVLNNFLKNKYLQ